MNETAVPGTEWILLREPRTDGYGNKIPVKVSMVKVSQTDLSNYSFFRSCGTYEEWVPTQELELYRRVFGDKE